MQRRQPQKPHKKVHIPQADAVADPGAVVVVRLDADAALGAVEGAGRPQKVTRRTER